MTANSPELGRDELPGGIERPGVVAVAGEALIDLVPTAREGLFEAVPGGSPANVAVGLARLGVPARLLARIAADPLGRGIRDHLVGNGVDLSRTVKAGEPTSLAIVAVGPDGSPEYDFRVQGTADWQWRDAELTGVLDDQVVALHGGLLAFTIPPGADALGRLFERAGGTATVSYDPNCRPLLMSALLASLHRRGLLGVDRRAQLSAVDTDTLSAVLDEAVLASAITCTRHGADPPTAQHPSTGIP
jgi:fructokinase